MSYRRILVISGGCVAIAACNTMNSHIGDEDAGFGEAVKYNAAIQTINPNPVYAPGGALPGDNGEKGAAAVKRYRTDKVNERHDSDAKSLSTTEGVSSGTPR